MNIETSARSIRLAPLGKATPGLLKEYSHFTHVMAQEAKEQLGALGLHGFSARRQTQRDSIEAANRAQQSMLLHSQKLGAFAVLMGGEGVKPTVIGTATWMRDLPLRRQPHPFAPALMRRLPGMSTLVETIDADAVNSVALVDPRRKNWRAETAAAQRALTDFLPQSQAWRTIPEQIGMDAEMVAAGYQKIDTGFYDELEVKFGLLPSSALYIAE